MTVVLNEVTGEGEQIFSFETPTVPQELFIRAEIIGPRVSQFGDGLYPAQLKNFGYFHWLSTVRSFTGEELAYYTEPVWINNETFFWRDQTSARTVNGIRFVLGSGCQAHFQLETFA